MAVAKIYTKINTKRGLTEGQNSYPALVKCIPSQLNRSLVVRVLSLLEGRIEVDLVVGSTLGTVRDKVDDTESNGVNTALETAEDASNGLGQRGLAQDALLSSNSLQEILLDLGKLSRY